MSMAWVAGALDTVAGMMASIGIASGSHTGRIPRLIRMLYEIRGEIGEWSVTRRGGDRVSYANAVLAAADLMLSLAAAILAKARSRTIDMVGLLRTWNTDRETVIRLAERPEWLLDGWEQICLIWRYARDDVSRRAAVAEIFNQIPVLPRELGEWSGHGAEMEELLLANRPIRAQSGLAHRRGRLRPDCPQ